MPLDTSQAMNPLLKPLADMLADRTPSPREIADATGDLVEALCKLYARPLPGGTARCSARSWNRQICLDIAMGAFGENDHRAELLDALHSAERTVWDGDALIGHADTIEAAAGEYAAELRGEAESLRERGT